MKDKQFDQLIKEKMERLEIPLEKGGWESFASRLEQSAEAGVPDQTEHDFDQLIFNKLHHIEAPFNPLHWTLMHKRIQAEFGWHRILLSHKLAETTLIAVLIFAASHQLKNTQPAMQVYPVASESIQHTAIADKQPDQITPVYNSNRNPYISQRKQTTTNPLNPTVKTPESGTPNNNFITPKYKKTSLPLNPTALHQVSLAGKDKPVLTPADLPLSSEGLSPAGYIENAMLPLVYSPFVDLESALSLPEKETLLRIGMSGSFDYNRIITPPDPNENRLEVYDRYARGYSSAVTVGFEMGKLEIETGLGYASKHYLPQQVVFVQGSLQEGFIGEGIREIELNMLSLPVNLKFHFLNREKWRVYVLAGTSLQFTFHNNYFTSTQSFTYSISKPLLNSGRVSPLEDNKDLKRGFFEGGPFKENSYLTGNLGLGIERNFSYRWSLFLQPTYQYSMDYFGMLDKRLGPNKDEISTFSVQTGIKMRLFK